MRIVSLAISLILISVLASFGNGGSFHSISCDGNMNDWSEDEAMGTVNSATLYITFDFANLYIGFHRGSVDNDMFVAIDCRDGGTNISLDWYGTHKLPFGADFYIGIENHSYAYLFRYNSSGWEEYRSVRELGGYVEDWNVNIELKIPLKILGYPDRINILAYGQWENAINVWAVWPITNPMGAGSQNFTNYISLPIKEGISPSDYMYGVKFPKPKFKIDGYLTDWSGDENLTKIEDSSEDSAGDLENVVENELYMLYVTWDNNYLYIGYEYRTGVWGDSMYDNGTMVFIDSSSPFDDGTHSLKKLNVWRRKINFGSFNCEYIFGKWDEQNGYLYHIINESFAKDISSEFICASTGGNGVRGAVEMAIPWRTIYGDNYREVMYRINGLKICAAIVGHDDEPALDTIPDVSDVNKNTNFSDEVTIDYFLSTGKIFSPPPLLIQNLSYNVTSGILRVNWSTNRICNSTFIYEDNHTTRIFYINNTMNFSVEVANVSEVFNFTIKAEDSYGNTASKTVNVDLRNVGDEENESEETPPQSNGGGNINYIALSILVAVIIIIAGEYYIRRMGGGKG